MNNFKVGSYWNAEGEVNIFKVPGYLRFQVAFRRYGEPGELKYFRLEEDARNFARAFLGFKYHMA